MERSPWALLSFFFFFFPQLPTLLSMPSSPPTVLGGSAFLFLIMQKEDRGRERRFVRFPLPPNRTGGSPASGSPVDGLTPKGIDEQFYGRLTD
jgi:hypothetical protein